MLLSKVYKVNTETFFIRSKNLLIKIDIFVKTVRVFIKHKRFCDEEYTFNYTVFYYIFYTDISAF